MEDGLLYLASRVYEDSADAIRAETEKRIAVAVNHPELGSSAAEEFAEGEYLLDELRSQFPQIVIDAVEGVDDSWEWIGRPSEWEELPF